MTYRCNFKSLKIVDTNVYHNKEFSKFQTVEWVGRCVGVSVGFLCIPFKWNTYSVVNLVHSEIVKWLCLEFTLKKFFCPSILFSGLLWQDFCFPVCRNFFVVIIFLTSTTPLKNKRQTAGKIKASKPEKKKEKLSPAHLQIRPDHNNLETPRQNTVAGL